MSRFSNEIFQLFFFFALIFSCKDGKSQHLSISTANDKNFLCPLSLRSFDAGYLPSQTNLLGSNYEFHDIRPLSLICDPANSVLNSAEEPVLLITKEWPCRYDATTVGPGSIVLLTIDSNEISGAAIGSFHNNSEQFGPAYVIATSKQCIDELYPQIDIIESVEFKPDGKPVYWNRANNPSYFISESMELNLPCVQDSPFTLAVTVLSENNLELAFTKDQSAEFEFSFMTFGHGLRDRRSKRYDPVLIGDKYIYNIAAGVHGDLIQINPRCTGVDSFLVSIDIKPVELTDSCMLQTSYPFSITERLDTMNSTQINGIHQLIIPLSNDPISFLSDEDDLKELPNRDPQGRHKSYYVYDDFLFDLVVGSRGACNQLNVDLNGGQVSSVSTSIQPQTEKNLKCIMTSTQDGYSCKTHLTSEVFMFSDFYSLGAVLPNLVDVARCKIGCQSIIVPAIQK